MNTTDWNLYLGKNWCMEMYLRSKRLIPPTQPLRMEGSVLEPPLHAVDDRYSLVEAEFSAYTIKTSGKGKLRSEAAKLCATLVPGPGKRKKAKNIYSLAFPNQCDSFFQKQNGNDILVKILMLKNDICVCMSE